MTVLTHSNISIRLPKSHAELIVQAAIEAREELSKWVATRALASACAELGVPEPLPEPPTRDRLRAAARAVGMSEEAFKAKALADAVELATRPRKSESPPAMRDSHGDSEPPPPPAKTPSGEYRINLEKLTPAQAVRQALTASGGEAR